MQAARHEALSLISLANKFAKKLQQWNKMKLLSFAKFHWNTIQKTMNIFVLLNLTIVQLGPYDRLFILKVQLGPYSRLVTISREYYNSENSINGSAESVEHSIDRKENYLGLEMLMCYFVSLASLLQKLPLEQSSRA